MFIIYPITSIYVVKENIFLLKWNFLSRLKM